MAGGFEFDMSQVNALAVSLGNTAKTVDRRAETVVRKTAMDVEATAKQFAPVDTGALRNSIGTDLYGHRVLGQVEAEVGPTVEYGAHVEFGTSRQAPAAYMGPALDRHSPEFVQALEQLGGEVL